MPKAAMKATIELRVKAEHMTPIETQEAPMSTRPMYPPMAGPRSSGPTDRQVMANRSGSRLARELDQRPLVVHGSAEDGLAQVARRRAVDREGEGVRLTRDRLAAGHARQGGQAVAHGLGRGAVLLDDDAVAAAALSLAQVV